MSGGRKKRESERQRETCCRETKKTEWKREREKENKEKETLRVKMSNVNLKFDNVT